MKHLPSALLLAAALVLAGCSKSDRAPAREALPIVPVRTVVVEARTTPLFEAVTGSVRPRQEAQISPRIVGVITADHAPLGRRVRAGDLLLELSAAEIDARYAQAEAALSQATRDHERESGLLARGASTGDTVKSLADRRRQAEAALDEARAMREYTRVLAPFDGTIAGDGADVGGLATPGTPLLYLQNEDTLRVEAGIPSLLPRIAPGTELLVRAGNRTTHARLAELSPAADPRSRTVLAKLDLPEHSGFRLGEFVRVEVPAGEDTRLLVPARAVTAVGQIERVFVVENGRAVLRIVRTTQEPGSEVLEVLSGLRSGETVVVPVPVGLKDGQPVEVAR
jgi:RND family efflux transporter MFP subunit